MGLAREVFICPCCHHERALEETPLEESFPREERPTTLSAMMFNYEEWLAFKQAIHEYTREKHSRFHTFLWACNSCLESGAALPGNPKKQSFGMEGPTLAYFSLTERCQNCGNDFLFSADEQQYWYETLGFHVDSYPKHCVVFPTLRN